MKAKSKRPDIRLAWRNKSSRRLLAGAVLGVATFLACDLANRALAGGRGQCLSADRRRREWTGCRASAQSDYRIALGKCVNVSDPAARKTCEKQATADLHDAFQTCKDGFGVRRGDL